MTQASDYAMSDEYVKLIQQLTFSTAGFVRFSSTDSPRSIMDRIVAASRYIGIQLTVARVDEGFYVWLSAADPCLN